MSWRKLSLILLLAIPFALAPVHGEATLIQSGDTVRIDFNLTGLTSGPPYLRLSTELAFGLAESITNPREGNLLDPGEGFLLRVFDANDAQLSSWDFIEPGPRTQDIGLAMFLNLTTATGYVTLTEIDGSFDLIESRTRIGVSTTTNGATWQYVPGTVTVNDASVPEPSTVLLLGSGIIGLWGFRKKYKK